ncbi:MAG: hypothetical protein A3G02_00395 [Candidatus Yanofskybacteria bacterium RIFCSPLOWO2_12_FULL_44_13b]|uniref:Uncharacterized protein n=1 Tax=Candidatus Yanofskybacteria bacterium RIFCSPLOWO2_02_FULL_44_18 TaxID=1802705 RepID=A0A1F8H0L0_9BACT|nr:MAG: hypothetical protein A3C01_00290 [Candidatus Yanofskybacteria bacterium RIFCSPHIGHO2_02_FULL_44_36b]OGN30800.1 MAG: hypothetical protein A3I96_03135 [Candidatus Yanofskybacteria bacterium RIFCSPLOWO2_02_FULL_44_18]OGN34921.1 MAG: hypothetical protein A3G02_00395 [Candidatus Yanofskybacteria bacterium RIFCSPLOWO2_12_FULL_44_13b]
MLLTNSTIEALQRHYGLFVDETNQYNFFLGLNDYLDYIKSITFLVSVMQETLKGRDIEYALLDQLENKAIKEMKSAKKRFFEITENKHIQSSRLTYALKEIKDYESGKLQLYTDNNFDSGARSSLLFSAASVVSEMGQREALNEFLVSNKEYRKHSGADSNTYGNFVFSKTIAIRRQQWNKIKELESEEIWGIVDKVLNFHDAWKNYRNIDTDPEKYVENCSLQETKRRVRVSIMASDIAEIKKQNQYHPSLVRDGEEDKNLLALNLDKFKKSIPRLHNFLLSKIEAEEKSEPIANDNIKQKMSFNRQTGIIGFGDIIHKFQRGTRGEKDRILLFKKLWDERRYIKNGVEKVKGKTHPPEFLAVQLNITENATTFSRNETAKNRFFGIIKGINRILKDKGFPAKIERKNGIQLVIIEK